MTLQEAEDLFQMMHKNYSEHACELFEDTFWRATSHLFGKHPIKRFNVAILSKKLRLGGKTCEQVSCIVLNERGQRLY